MNDENINEETEDTEPTQDSAGRPIGYWLRTVDALISREFAAAFDGEGVSRRDWMLLNIVSGDVKAPGFAERLARKGKRLRGLEQLGWAQESGDGTWILTDEGRAAKERLGAIVEGIRARVAGAVSPEDFATTLASLEAIARELGWDEDQRTPRPGFGRGFGRAFGRGFGPRPFGHDIHQDFGPNLHHGFRPGFGPGGGPNAMPDDEAFDAPHHGHSHSEHRHGHSHGEPDHGHGRHGFGHGRDRHQRGGDERAYERGFDAGFSRGQAAAS